MVLLPKKLKEVIGDSLIQTADGPKLQFTQNRFLSELCEKSSLSQVLVLRSYKILYRDTSAIGHT